MKWRMFPLDCQQILVRCTQMNNKIQIKTTTIYNNVEYLVLLAQLRYRHHNNSVEQPCTRNQWQQMSN